MKNKCEEYQGRWSEARDKEGELEGEDMTLCLYECLRAVGLQCHYARFTSTGVCRASHLCRLTMEDYPILGIRSMEDRTRLFHLIQMVKTLDLENLEYEDCDDDEYYTDGVDDSYGLVNNRITYDGCGDPDEDVYDREDEKDAAESELSAASISEPSCVRRRLDFSCENTEDHQKLFSRPVGTIHVHTSRNRNNEPDQAKASATHEQFELDTESAVVCNCKGNNNNHRSHIHSHQSDHDTGANTKEGISLNNSFTRSSTKCVSSHKRQPNQQTKQKFSNKPVRHRDRKGIPRKDKLSTEVTNNMASEHMTIPVYESKRTAGYNYGLPLNSPPAPNKKKLVGQRISVCVRKRPLTRTEWRRSEADVVTTPSGECVIVHESKEAVDLSQYILQHRFYFDQVFGEESSNEDVYQRTAFPLVQHMLSGGKATCFAYGQTGAGKTHTMLGSSPGRPGLYAMAVRDIFAHLSTTRTQPPLLVYVSFFEIYCGQLYDLLDHRKRLFAREDGQKVVHIAGLRDVRVDSVSSLLQVISQGTEERTQGMSGVNPLSSRSHALLQIQLRGPNQQVAGRMSFVDLAGSERASDTKEPDRQSRLEGAEINQSLLALKECIRSLDQEQSHTPFRQSKLTQVLKDSFVGDSMTCMIANISPGHLASEHTLNTLRYADRVKELRGQGGLRGGRRSKTTSSPKRNLSNSNSSTGGSSVGTRGKSPPKKPKLGRQREASGPTTPPSRLATGGTILCSTPRWGDDPSARGRQGLGFEQITPIRGLLEMDDENEKVERAGRREGNRRERNEGTDSACHSTGDQNMRGGLVFGQARDEQRDSRLNCREKENQQSPLKQRREGKTRWIEQIRHVESSRDTCGEAERCRTRDLEKADERDQERKRHLRLYHQQLQQFIPSSASSDHLFSPSLCLSFSSSNQSSPSSASPFSSSSSLQQSSRISALMYHGLKEEVLDAYRARVEVRTDGSRGQLSSFSGRETCLQTETSPSCSKNKDEVGRGDSGRIREDWMAALDITGAGCGPDKGTTEKRSSLKATGEGEVRVRREDSRPTGVKGDEERRWAWVATAETQQADRMTAAGPADVEALMSYSCDSEVGEEGVDVSDVPADRMWSTEEQVGADSYSSVSTHNNSFSNQSPNQRAPAERPLSPICENTNKLLTPNKLGDLSLKSKHNRCTSNILPLPLPNTHRPLPLSSCTEKEPWFAANANRREFSNAQSKTPAVNTPSTQNGCKIPTEHHNMLSENPAYTQVPDHPEVKAEMSVLATGETSTDSLSYIMDPLSISLLQVDQQAATASFLQGEQSNTSLCLFETENRRSVEKERLTCLEMAGRIAEDEDKEFCLSLLELPQAKTHCISTSDTMTATDHSERREDVCCVTYEHCGRGMTKPAIPEVMLVSLQDQRDNQRPQTTPAIEVFDNKAQASPLKPSMCASVETSVMQSITSSVQHSGNTGTPSSQSPMTNGATQMAPEYAHNVPSKCAFSITTPQSKRVRGQLNMLSKQCHTVHSNQSCSSTVHVQPNGPTESNQKESTSNLQNRPIIHLSTLEDLYHSQWCVVQAHWEQLEEMETLCHREGTLLCQQPDMAFGEYVYKLGEIMERKAQCVHNMIAQLRPYLKTSQTSHSDQKNDPGEDGHDQVA